MNERADTDPRLAFGGLVLGALCIGFASIFAKLALSTNEIGSTAVAFWRTGLAGVVLTAIRFAAGLNPSTPRPNHRVSDAQPSLPRVPGALGLAGPGVLFALDLATWHYAFRFTTAAHATLLANLQVVLVGLYGWLVLKERVPFRFVGGAALALGGVAALLDAPGGGATLYGNLWAVSTAFFYAAYLLTIRSARQHADALTVMMVASLVAAATSFGLVLALGEPWWPRTLDTWIWVFSLALVSHVGGQGLIAWSLPHLPVSRAGLTLLLQPVFAAVFGAWILEEQLSATQVAAGALVLVGLEVARRAQSTPRIRRVGRVGRGL